MWEQGCLLQPRGETTKQPTPGAPTDRPGLRHTLKQRAAVTGGTWGPARALLKRRVEKQKELLECNYEHEL